MDRLKIFNTNEEYEAAEANGFEPKTVSLIFSNNKVKYTPDYKKRYLTFTALESGTFSNTAAVSYSLNEGKTWISLAANTQTPAIQAGEKIMWKNVVSNYSSAGTFSSTGRFNISGNISSMSYGDNFQDVYYIRGLRSLFEGSNVVSAANLVISGNTVDSSGLYYTFKDCTLLTTAPEISVSSLGNGSGNYHCAYMFSGCTSLTKAPSTLPANIGRYSCFHMFDGCTSLVKAPILPSLDLYSCCYDSMFYGCSRLNYIKALFSGSPSTGASSPLFRWVQGVPSTGTFVKNAASSFNVRAYKSNNYAGIPSGWTIENETVS